MRLVALLLFVALSRCSWAANTTQNFFQPYGEATVTTLATHDQIGCVVVPARLGIAAATKMAAAITATCGASNFAAWGIYPNDDNGTQIATFSAACTSTGVKNQTGLTSFGLVADKAYRICVCMSSNGVGEFLGLNTASGALDTLLNAFTTHAGISASNCSSGVMNVPTTGALTPSTSVSIPVLEIE